MSISFMPARLPDIETPQGVSVGISPAFTRNGAALDLDGYTFNLTSTSDVATLEETDLGGGILTIRFDTDGDPGVYTWLLEWTSGSGVVQTPLTGRLIIRAREI